MITKENKQTAEQIATDCEPLFKKCAQLLAKARKSEEAHRVARDRAFYWFYVKANGGNPYGDHLTSEEKAEAMRTRENDPKRWHEITDELFVESAKASDEARARAVNYANYCAYTLQVVGMKARPIIKALTERKGLETFGEILTAKAHNLRPRLWVEGIYNNLNQMTIGANIYGGAVLNTSYIYFNFNHDSEKSPTAPKLHTGATYRKALRKLEEVRKQAQALVEKSRAIAKDEGLYGFEEFIGHLAMTK